ncbi:MAG: DUF11 domain-containing protein, partial [Acidobacteriota bacterium]
MKHYRSKENAEQRPVKLNLIISATILIVLFTGLSAFGWGTPSAATVSWDLSSRQPSAMQNSLNGNFTVGTKALSFASGSKVFRRNDFFNPEQTLAAANGVFLDGIADLAISKSDSVTTIDPGATTVYVIRIKNVGTATVSGALLQDAVTTAGLTLISTACNPVVTVPANKCTSAPSLAVLTGSGAPLPDMAPNDVYNLNVTATVSATPPPAVTNTAAVSLAGGPAGNGAFDTNIVNRVDLAVTKSDGSLTYTPGAGISYQIIVKNNGPSDATGVAISDTVPAAITGVTYSCVANGVGSSCGTSGPAGNNVSFTNAIVPFGVTNFLTITVSGTVIPTATGNLTNSVHVEPGPQPDTDLSNNDATDTDTPALAVDLAVTKTDGSATYTAGNAISYAIVVTNNGPSNATGASVTDVVPAAITGVSVGCVASGAATCGTNGSGGNNVSFTGVNIAAGGANFLTITVSGTVSPSTTGDLTNSVHVTPGNETDTNLSNNDASDTDTPFGTANLIICKQLAPGDPIPVNTIFAFTSPSFVGTINVPAGPSGSPNCSSAITVAAGTASVTETAQPDTVVTDITADPAGRFVSKDLANRTGVVSVPVSPQATKIIFTNHGTGTGTGVIEICKQIAQGDALAVG